MIESIVAHCVTENTLKEELDQSVRKWPLYDMYAHIRFSRTTRRRQIVSCMGVLSYLLICSVPLNNSHQIGCLETDPSMKYEA